MRESFAAFKELVHEVSREPVRGGRAATRMRYLTNALALYEVHVARYYYNRGAYVAAANRAQAALLNLPAARRPTRTRSTSWRRATTGSDMPQLRDDIARVLAKTFPDSTYLAAGEQPWWKFW